MLDLFKKEGENFLKTVEKISKELRKDGELGQEQEVREHASVETRAPPPYGVVCGWF